MRLKSALATFAFAVGMGGCASTSQVADQIVRSNLAQEMAQNQLMLLNVVRAYEHRPMHFTQISAIRLPVGIGNSNFTVPLPIGAGSQTYTLQGAFGIQQGVDTTVLNSQEFMRGITTPLDPALMAYYLDQGWPQQMVLHLFVREIEFYVGDSLSERFVNYPEDRGRYEAFRTQLEKLLDCKLDPEPVDGKNYGPLLAARQIQDLKELAAAKTAGLALKGDRESGASSFQPVVPSKAVRLSLVQLSSGKCPNGTLAIAGEGAARKKNSVVLVLRSPEAMLYYLGEIARAQLKRGADASGSTASSPSFSYGSLRAQHCKDRVTLFRVTREQNSESAVSVTVDGANYSVPKGGDCDRSMHTLSLVTQIIGLQNKGTDLPSTANVRIVR